MTFKEFYIQWYARTISFAREYVISKDDAEDIVQDVFLQLLPRYDEHLHRINMVAYLFRSVKNKCIDYLRSKVIEQKAVAGMQEEMQLSLKMKFDSLEVLDDGLFDEHSIEEILENALNTLPDRCREIFVKHKIDGMKQKEIARELGISEKTVENQITIAYRKMREVLKPYFPMVLFFTLSSLRA
ncbi:MAG: RNA polymerase sigma-70 factor [Tannerella sp.]|nr:RNA polymerase sigma-70 factor [Tannerella sp.]